MQCRVNRNHCPDRGHRLGSSDFQPPIIDDCPFYYFPRKHRKILQRPHWQRFDIPTLESFSSRNQFLGKASTTGSSNWSSTLSHLSNWCFHYSSPDVVLSWPLYSQYGRLSDGAEPLEKFPFAGGVFVDVWVGNYKDRKVAVKALKVSLQSNLGKMRKVEEIW